MNKQLKKLYKLVLKYDWKILQEETVDNVVHIVLIASTAGPFEKMVLTPRNK